MDYNNIRLWLGLKRMGFPWGSLFARVVDAAHFHYSQIGPFPHGLTLLFSRKIQVAVSTSTWRRPQEPRYMDEGFLNQMAAGGYRTAKNGWCMLVSFSLWTHGGSWLVLR